MLSVLVAQPIYKFSFLLSAIIGLQNQSRRNHYGQTTRKKKYGAKIIALSNELLGD